MARAVVCSAAMGSRLDGRQGAWPVEVEAMALLKGMTPTWPTEGACRPLTTSDLELHETTTEAHPCQFRLKSPLARPGKNSRSAPVGR